MARYIHCIEILMISHQHRCIFVHIPKCGGTSIENSIWLPGEKRGEQELWMGFVSRYRNKYQTGGLQHLTARHVRQEVGNTVFNAYYKFTIVRNPFDRIVSQFAYMQQRSDLMEYIGMTPDTEFKKYLDLISRKLHVQWMPQCEFIFDSDDSPMVDFIGRLENIDLDAKKIFKTIGLDSPDRVPRVKRSKRGMTCDYFLDTETVEMVADMFSDDIRLLGYPANPF